MLQTPGRSDVSMASSSISTQNLRPEYSSLGILMIILDMRCNVDNSVSPCGEPKIKLMPNARLKTESWNCSATAVFTSTTTWLANTSWQWCSTTRWRTSTTFHPVTKGGPEDISGRTMLRLIKKSNPLSLRPPENFENKTTFRKGSWTVKSWIPKRNSLMRNHGNKMMCKWMSFSGTLQLSKSSTKKIMRSSI